MNTILIYGPGCAKCNELLANTNQITAELEGDFTIRKITDPMQFAVAGVFMTPGLSLNGKLLFTGRNPSPSELKEIIQAALGTPLATPTQEPCCSNQTQEKKPSSTKKIILCTLLILLALLAVKAINHSNKQEAPQDVPTLR